MYPGSRSAAYDRSATMFSPDGRLYQVEYATKIIEKGTPGAALKCDNGILFGADKHVPTKLLLANSIEKLFLVDDHIGAISSGLVGDARRLVEIARQKAQENQMYYDEAIHVETLVKEISGVQQLFTQYAGMRPFGVSFIIGGIDETGKRLFETEPSGALAEYRAIAIGKGKNQVMDLFEKEFKENMPFEEGMNLLLKGLQKGVGEKERLSPERLDFAFISEKNKFQKIATGKLRSYLGKLK